MPVNSAAAPIVRSPRLRLLVNGAIVPNPISADITSNNHYAADRFRVTLALAGASAAPWCATMDLDVDIQISLDGGSTWTSLLEGSVDTIEFDPLADTVRLAGRDHTAALIEARTQETFANQTASEIAQQIADRHGLVVDVVATTALVGRYWEREHDRTTLDQFGQATTEWDLLVALAQREGFDVWVSGRTLHFRPAEQNGDTPSVLRPFSTATGAANVIALHLERALVLAKPSEVTVKSWNSRQQTAFTQTVTNSMSTSAMPVSATRYIYIVPNLTPDGARQMAEQKLGDLSRQARVVSVDLPGELTLRPRMRVQLEGTNTDFDQVYRIDEISRHLDFHSGFTERIRASDVQVTA